MMDKLKAIFTILFPNIVGIIVGLIISNSIDYNSLNQPPLSPPTITFPIVWSILYLLMGISYYLIIKDNKNYSGKKLYYVQLFVNYLWSIIFFLFKWRFISILWIILLDFLVILMIKSFYKENKLSAFLQIPYLLWILFATYLTIGVYILN